MCDPDSEGLVTIVFEPDGNTIRTPPGISIFKAAVRAGNKIRFECGGNGKCGKCRVIVKNQGYLTEITVKEKKHLSPSEIERSYRLACQALIKRNIVVFVPPESRVERRKIQVTGFERSLEIDPMVKKFHVALPKPTLSDVRPDFERLIDTLNDEHGLERLEIDHEIVKELPCILRKAEWGATVAIWNDNKIIAVESGDTSEKIFGLSVDVGTSKIVVYLIDLITGETLGVGFVENPQIVYGEDLITRISHAMNEEDGLKTLQSQAVRGINEALQDACKVTNVDPTDIYEATVVGNTVMHHLLLAIEPRYISSSPFTPAIKRPINVEARKLNIKINPSGIIHVLPLIAGFVGADAVADILSSGISESKEFSLLLDIGTNTEIFVGNAEGLISCSCASGPAFEGGHIKHGMKAVTGAIERVSLNPTSYEAEYETIGGGKPRGLCGSAIIDVVAEMWKYGIINSRGMLDLTLETPRLKKTNGKSEFVLVSKDDSASGQEIVITQRDINEVQLAKAAIYSGCSILMKRKRLRDEDLAHILIAGAFGEHLNPENAKLIGLVPNLPTEKIRFVGNTAITGSKMALISRGAREQAEKLAKTVKYLELSVDPLFRSEFTSALFIPHKDLNRFSSVRVN